MGHAARVLVIPYRLPSVCEVQKLIWTQKALMPRPHKNPEWVREQIFESESTWMRLGGSHVCVAAWLSLFLFWRQYFLRSWSWFNSPLAFHSLGKNSVEVNLSAVHAASSNLCTCTDSCVCKKSQIATMHAALWKWWTPCDPHTHHQLSSKQYGNRVGHSRPDGLPPLSELHLVFSLRKFLQEAPAQQACTSCQLHACIFHPCVFHERIGRRWCTCQTWRHFLQNRFRNQTSCQLSRHRAVDPAPALWSYPLDHISFHGTKNTHSNQVSLIRDQA